LLPTACCCAYAQVTIKTGFLTANNEEEALADYLCDWPGCANVAVHVLGCVKEIASVAAACEKHLAAIKARTRTL
jgi:hypothetical protein